MSQQPVTPRPAATLILARDGAQGIEIFMMQRSLNSDFVGGAYVFPGGGLDKHDSSPEAAALCLPFPARALDFDSLLQFARTVGSLFAAAGRGFLDGLFDRFAGFAGALLNAAQQFILLAFGELKIVIRELGSLLFQLALGDVPVALDFECVHGALFCFVFRL